jgi:DNA alkylation repair enzyme
MAMNGANRALIEELRQRLRNVADPTRAPRMQAYMKSTMPYLGVPSSGVKTVCGEVFAHHQLGSFRDWTGTVRALWREARYREERLGLSDRRSGKDLSTLFEVPPGSRAVSHLRARPNKPRGPS